MKDPFQGADWCRRVHRTPKISVMTGINVNFPNRFIHTSILYANSVREIHRSLYGYSFAVVPWYFHFSHWICVQYGCMYENGGFFRSSMKKSGSSHRIRKYSNYFMPNPRRNEFLILGSEVAYRCTRTDVQYSARRNVIGRRGTCRNEFQG